MARFTHLARAKDEKAIVRNGIKPTALRDGTAVVHAMPILPDFFASHQWLRELRRRSSEPLVAIDFVVPDEEPVRVGHYSQPHTPMTAAEASGLILHADDARGYEVVIPRKIEPAEIRRTREVRQVVGWRYWPEAHGRPPCGCPACQFGTFKAAQLRAAD